MTKIERLWKAFTGRYGSFQLKDGQDEGYVRKSWEIAFERFSEAQLMEAARRYMSHSKYERWPSTGDLQEVLDEMRKLSPSPGRDEFAGMSPEWKRDYAAFCTWWESVPLFLGREGEPLAKRDEVFADFMAGERGTFAMQAVKAWRKNIPEFWSIAVNTYLDRMRTVFGKRAAVA